MEVCSLQFLVLFLLLVMALPYVPGVRGRQLTLAGCNLAFLGTYFQDARTWLYAGAFVLSGYAAGRLLRRFPSRWGLVAYVTALAAVFVVLRRYQFIDGLLPGRDSSNPSPSSA